MIRHAHEYAHGEHCMGQDGVQLEVFGDSEEGAVGMFEGVYVNAFVGVQ